MLGHEFAACREFSAVERLYIRLFGMPILGLRIRAWRMLPLIQRYAAEAQRILDVGSGRGVLTLEIAKRLPQAEVIGLDHAYEYKIEMAKQIAQQRGLRNCHFEVGDFWAADFPHRFDAIVAIDVLEHLRDDAAAVQRFAALLQPGGVLIIHVPHYYRNIWGRRHLNFADIEGHERIGYLQADLLELLRRAGLRLLTHGYTYASCETLANDLSYLITGGRERQKALYSLAFPFLLALAYTGKGVTPRFGSGLYCIGQKER